MRALRRVVEDADVQRALERDAARDDDQEAVLPERGVVRGELLLRRDERVQPLVVVAEGLEGDAVRCSLDLDPALADGGQSGDVELDHRPARTRPRDSPSDVAVRGEAVR